MTIVPASAIIATLDRRARLVRTVASLLAQDHAPAEIVIVDASNAPITTHNLPALPPGVTVRCQVAEKRGAAAQRNQAVRAATQPHLLFLDDDIDLEPHCVRRLWQRLQSDSRLAGCGARLVNAPYHPPGGLHRRLLAWLGCPSRGSLAGRCCGPALNFLPGAGEDQPADDHVEWLNLGCTLYRRAALPDPPFLSFFHGYSLLEDVALSTHVARRWTLACPPAATVYHDTQPASYKHCTFERERMEVLNRAFILQQILQQRGPAPALRHLGYQLLMTAVSLRTAGGWRRLPANVAGKLAGAWAVIRTRHRWTGYADSTA